jgi:hypothetical protein
MSLKKKLNCHNKKISLMKDNWYNLSINVGILRYKNKIIKWYIDLHG